VPSRPALHAVAIAALLTTALAGTAQGSSPGIPGGVPPDPAGQPPSESLSLNIIKGGFSQPVFVTHAGDDRLFVVERTGRIRIMREIDGQWRTTSTFLDLRGSIATSHPEQGLLGLAFHPDYATNGLLYVDYTRRNGDTVVAEYRAARAGKADPESRRVLLRIAQPFDNHNGGWLGFMGDTLLIATGDGGSGGDPFGNAQDKDSLLGKILRIDPLDPPGAARYSIPADNPLVGRAGRDEIWAWGLRNPWRDSVDRLTGDLFIGDVGQDTWEEISHAGDGRGRNFGWDRVEGFHSYPSGERCTTGCRTLPIAEYQHTDGNCSVTGGYVSRREGAPLFGRYLFGDYCTGNIWSIPATFDGGDLPAPLDTPLLLSSFGEGADGTLYAVSLSGEVYRIVGS
jgi:glucose/arabinose dehydrogenase